jgi:hypothetical protein
MNNKVSIHLLNKPPGSLPGSTTNNGGIFNKKNLKLIDAIVGAEESKE